MNILHEVVPHVRDAIEEVQEDMYMVAIKMHKSIENVGIVLVYRPSDDSWITWEWVHRGVITDGLTSLHTGHYDMDYDEGMMDFEARGR